MIQHDGRVQAAALMFHNVTKYREGMLPNDITTPAPPAASEHPARNMSILGQAEQLFQYSHTKSAAIPTFRIFPELKASHQRRWRRLHLWRKREDEGGRGITVSLSLKPNETSSCLCFAVYISVRVMEQPSGGPLLKN